MNGKFLGAHISHASIIICWADSMCLFEISHFVCDKPLYEQGFIILAHLGSLELRIEVSGETRTTYPYFIISVLHLICSALLSLGGIFHAIFDPSSFLETIGVNVFAFCYQDRYRITAILVFI
jgi:photosystem II CP43 chlorophyll apoprotein